MSADKLFQVGTLNRTGRADQGSHDIWTRNYIAELLDRTAAAFKPNMKHVSMIGWVNGNEYQQSAETFGILPLAEDMRVKLGMSPYHHTYATETKIRHRYLAEHQQTRVAVLPIHTQQERSLYRLLVKQQNGLFSGTKQPNWVAVACEWSKYADGLHIFYKVCKLARHDVID